MLAHQFLYWVPCLFRFQSPVAVFSQALAVDPGASSQTSSGALCCARVKCTEAVLALVLQKNLTNISYIIFLFIRELMKKVVKRGKEKDPWDSVDEKLTNLT